MVVRDLRLFADYFQFYLQDESADGDLSNAWSREAADRLLAVSVGVVGVGTVRNMHVPVQIEIREAEPDADFNYWDHVTECSLDVLSTRLVVAGCTDYFPDAARIELRPGSYRVRVCYGSLSKLSEDGLDGDDHYRVVLWPGTPCSPYVIKARPADPT